ncbi:MAG: hypothetical protein IKO23_10420 [Bacteroidales bacterium]|nr:hypothetical protein [Bacteroidales bacterium]
MDKEQVIEIVKQAHSIDFVESGISRRESLFYGSARPLAAWPSCLMLLQTCSSEFAMRERIMRLPWYDSPTARAL